VVRNGETGVLVPSGDAPALASAIGQLLEDVGERARLAARARVLIEERFDSVTTARELRGVFASCARGARLEVTA
jgi:glycosyltransferase involved in cell wall biosynthesis